MSSSCVSALSSVPSHCADFVGRRRLSESLSKTTPTRGRTHWPLQSTWWYPYDMLKRHDNFPDWCSQYAIRTVPPPNGYLLYREVGSINNYYSFEFCPVQPIDNGTYVVWYSTASIHVPPGTSYNDESESFHTTH